MSKSSPVASTSASKSNTGIGENLLGVYEKLIIAHLFVFIKEKMDILNLMKMILLQLFQ